VGDPLVSVPEHMLNARLEWRATPRLETFLGVEYRSSAFRPRNFHEPQNGGNAQGAFDALGDFKGFTLVDLGASYQFADNVRLSGVIYNLFDKDFKDYWPYLREDNGQVAFSNVYNNIYEPRRLFLSLIVDF
jgi:outer membrane receptor for ferrienterochelin and colicins